VEAQHGVGTMHMFPAINSDMPTLTPQAVRVSAEIKQSDCLVHLALSTGVRSTTGSPMAATCLGAVDSPGTRAWTRRDSRCCTPSGQHSALVIAPVAMEAAAGKDAGKGLRCRARATSFAVEAAEGKQEVTRWMCWACSTERGCKCRGSTCDFAAQHVLLGVAAEAYCGPVLGVDWLVCRYPGVVNGRAMTLQQLAL
jgi:hypothetical protein